MNLISQSQVKLHRQYHLVLTLHIKIDLFIYVPLHCCCHRKGIFFLLRLGNWQGGFTHLQAWIYVVPEHVEHSRPLMFKRLLLVHSALEHIQCFNCCSSKIVNTKVGPVIDIDKALLMTKLLHCLMIACKIVFCGQFSQRGWAWAMSQIGYLNLLGTGGGSIQKYVVYSGINSNWIDRLFRNNFRLD